jgi:predicted negative regulator of RcsB-dependent stress response
MAESTPANQEIEQTLNKTDFGHLIYEYRKMIVGLVIAAIVGVTGYILWKQSQEAKAETNAEAVFKFQSTTWAEAKLDKVPAADLVKSFTSLPSEVQTSPTMLPVVLDMGEHLYKKGAYAEADMVLSKVSDTKHALSQFFVVMQRTVVLEKLGKSDEAIGLLEKLSQNKDAPMPQKVSLELGRLYKVKGEKAKAQSQFESIIANYPNDEYAKVAKLYLSQLNQ